MDECRPSAPCGLDTCPACATEGVGGDPVELADIRLPDEFWSARPMFKHVQAAAWADRAHPDAVLGAFLARWAASVPPGIKFNSGPDGRPPDGSTNLYACLLAPSGIGKSRASTTAERLTTIAGITPYDTYGLGSGEGLIEAFLGLVERPVFDPFTGAPKTGKGGVTVTEKVKAQVREKVFFYVDEGAALNTLVSRVGATLGPTLRSAWNGGELGQANATAETTRRLSAGRYSIGLLIGYQPSTAGQLLADAGTGMPQRFLWFGAQDRQMPAEPMPWPGRLETPALKAGAVEFDQGIKRELVDYDVAKHHGAVVVDELDSHEPLLWCKVAALLCLADGRYLVGEEDWLLAKTIVITSATIRNALVEQMEAERDRVRQEIADDLARTDVARRTGRRDVQRVAERIRHKAERDGWFHFGRWKRDQGRDKKWCDDALKAAEAYGWVVIRGEAIEPGGNSP